MNKTELLQKLIALANNNPNENEANLAARKVCRLLVELKVNFKSQSPSPIPGFQPSPRQAQYWRDVVRSTEPEFKSSRPTSSGNPFANIKFDFDVSDDFWQYFSGGNRGGGKTYKTKIPKDYKPYFHYDIPKEKPNPNYNADGTRVKKPKEIKKCTECGKLVETAYVGNLFICNTCQWNKYEQSKKGNE